MKPEKQYYREDFECATCNRFYKNAHLYWVSMPGTAKQIAICWRCTVWYKLKSLVGYNAPLYKRINEQIGTNIIPIPLKRRPFIFRVWRTYRNYRTYMRHIGILQAMYMTWLTTCSIPMERTRNKKRPAK